VEHYKKQPYRLLGKQEIKKKPAIEVKWEA
jgi:hypothetical protein